MNNKTNPILSLPFEELVKSIQKGEISFKSVCAHYGAIKIAHALGTKDFLKCLSDNHNIINRIEAYELFHEGFLNYDDVKNIGIDELFIKKVFDNHDNIYFRGHNIKQLPLWCTNEIYLFGVPFSGKTSMLSLLLNTMINLSDVKKFKIMTEGSSYAYDLISTFSDIGVNSFPFHGGRNYLDNTNFLDIKIQRGSHKKNYRFINFNSELVLSLYRRPISLDKNDLAYNDYQNFIINNLGINQNIKQYIFVIPYEDGDIFFNEYRISVLYENLLNYMFHDGVFKNVVSIHIVITQTDKIINQNDIESELNSFLDKYYHEFCNRLESICRENKIKSNVIGFSCGETCFKDLVKVDFTSSKKLFTLLDSFSSVDLPKWKMFLHNIFKN